MPRISTYQRMKIELAKARGELYTVVMEPDSVQATLIRMNVQTRAALERQVFSGSHGNGNYGGLRSQLKAGGS